ncbi:hypothetical protein [Nocardia sp. NPDC046763]|uniref:hypothetical protein n=1 Tax=Nocardia sp. NPDC046763 TaxID=3155256 RepID=UPI0033CCB2B5
MSGNEVDEAARNWPQVMALIMQMWQRIQRASADGSIRLSRTEYKQFMSEFRDAQKLLTHQIDTTRAWYQARTEEYQRESRAATARAQAGASAEEQASASAYLSGLRAGIEHTIHDTVLTAEQRGQVVQALDAVDTDPGKPVPRNVFEPVTDKAAVQARFAAAESENRVAVHREQRAAATEESAKPATAGTTEMQRESAKRFDELSKRIEQLEERLEVLVPRESATAATADGHAKPRATQKSNHTAHQHNGQAQPRAEEQAQEQPSNGAATHAPAAQAESPEQSHQPQASAEAAAEFIAEMEAEA